jgi:peptidoglycan/LPS O-acetylase OafA/YrhL
MTTGAVDPGKAWRATHGIPIVPAFDGYRALAVLGVVLFHIFEVCGITAVAGTSLGGILIWGLLPRSIIIFFIVSGFVMFLPTAVRGGDFGRVKSFAIGRAARILPAYWLSLLVALLLLVTFAHPAITPPGLPPIGSVLAHFALLETPGQLVAGPVGVDGATVGSLVLGFGVIPPVWTMSVEAGFYFVLPLVATAYFRRPLVGLACAAGVVLGWHAVAVNIGDVASAFGLDASAATEARFRDFYASQFPSWALALATGMTSAWAYVRLRDRVAAATLERGALWTLAATLPVAALVVYMTGHEAVHDINPLNGLFARQSIGLTLAYPLVMGTAMVAFSLAPMRVQRPLANEPVRGLADVSYSVYLIHFAVIWFALSQLSLPEDGSLWSGVAWSALVFPVSILYAYFSAHLLERPIRRWAQRFRRAGREDPETAPAGRATPTVDAGPPVSVVIPTLNRANWLREAMDSVLSQDYRNLELVVVDDGSTDETPELLAQYERRNPEERFRFLRQENAGQARALNRGNRLARGEIIGYLSDDDLLAPGAVTRLTSELIADPRAAVVYPEYRSIDEEGKVEDTVRPIEYSPVAALRLHDTIIGPGGLARRWALDAAGGWDSSYRWMGDLILWMGVGLAGRAIRVDEPLASWRKHSGSVTIELSPDHAREHLAVVEHGLGMPGLPSLSRSTSAEALRNACLFGALFGGQSGTWPEERFVPFDLHRKRISAWSAGLPPDGDVDWDAAERGADACRELVELTAELAELRATRSGTEAPATTWSSSSGADEDAMGVVAARQRLREAGALPDDGGSYADGVGEREMRLALLEAAVACGYEVEPGSSRFFILDRLRAPLSDAELEALLNLTIGGSHHELREAAERKRRELQGLREPSEA